MDTTLMFSDERRAAAHDAYRQSLLDSQPLTGAEVGDRFSRSARWGRARIAEVHASQNGSDDATEPAAVPAKLADECRADRHWEPPPEDVAVSPAIRRTTTLAVLAVAVVAAVASFDHQRLLAEMVGEGWRSWLLPISVDGLVVAASMSLLVQRRAGQKAGALACGALALGLGASLAANVVAADTSIVDLVLVRRIVAAWPPIALGISFELLLKVLRLSQASSD